METGEWVDSDWSGLPDAGEAVTYTILVGNAGTVTLENVEVTDTSGVVTCDDMVQPVASLVVGGSYECTASRQVGVVVHGCLCMCLSLCRAS